VEQWAELRREHFVRGVSIKELMRRTGLARNTIRSALRSEEPPGFRCPERPSKLDPFKEEIHELLRGDPALPGVRVRELIEPLGFDGGKSSLLRTRWTPSPCGRLSRPRTTTGPPSHPGGISRRQAFPPASILLAGEGTTGMVPTFTLNRLTG
jgi:hypothetical protein